MIQRRRILQAFAPVPAMLMGGRAFAQSTPIRILVGAPAGGSTDTLARTLSIEMGRLLGRTVIVENRPGAGGNIAADAVAKAAPDGNTLLMSFTSHAINASLYPSLPAKDVRELIALAKAKPGKLNFAIGAVGSSLHLAGDAFKMQSGAYIVNIPYRGTAPALQDVLAGQVDLMFAAVGNAQAQIRAGKLKALGVTSAKRLPAFPDVPAIAEVLPGYESSAWFGLFGPGQMNPELAKRLSDAARQAIATPDVKKRLELEGAVPVGNSPDEFARFVQAEIPRWAKVVKFAGAKPE